MPEWPGEGQQPPKPGHPAPEPPVECVTAPKSSEVMVKLSDVRLAIIGHFQTGSVPLSELDPIADSIIERIPKAADQNANTERIYGKMTKDLAEYKAMRDGKTLQDVLDYAYGLAYISLTASQRIGLPKPTNEGQKWEI